MDYPATHPVILPYNKLHCINHFQPPSRPSCQWKPKFKQRFHQIHSVHIVLQLVRYDLITGLQVLWGQNYGIQYLEKNAWVLENWPRFRGWHPQPYPSAWICPVLRLWSPTPTLLKPASMHEFTQVWGMWCTSSPPPLLTELHTFYAFIIGSQLKIIGCASPPPPPRPLRPALPTLRPHLYSCSCTMKPDGRPGIGAEET